MLSKVLKAFKGEINGIHQIFKTGVIIIPFPSFALHVYSPTVNVVCFVYIAQL